MDLTPELVIYAERLKNFLKVNRDLQNYLILDNKLLYFRCQEYYSMLNLKINNASETLEPSYIG
jgi:hypothetical protein